MTPTETLTDEGLDAIEREALYEHASQSDWQTVLILVAQVRYLRDKVMDAYDAGHQHGIWGDPPTEELRAKGYVR